MQPKGESNRERYAHAQPSPLLVRLPWPRQRLGPLPGNGPAHRGSRIA